MRKSETDLIHRVCDILDELIQYMSAAVVVIAIISSLTTVQPMTFDMRLKSRKLNSISVGPAERIETGLYKTVSWYVGRHLAVS